MAANTPILNQNLDWRTIPPDVRKAFRGPATKILIPAHGTLCRFITGESKKKSIRGNEIFLSPWWTEWSSTFRLLTNWRRSGASTVQTVRSKLAVTKEFSEELDCLLQIVLTRPVFAFKGIASHQDDNIQGITYILGATQLYLPNLASDQQGMSSSVAYIQCFTSIDSLG